MVTLIEVLDSAVKIGLGAAIAGVTSYFVAWKNHAHERKKGETEDRRRLALELAIAIEKVESSLNETAFHYQEANLTLARQSLIPVSREAYTARALGNLLGSNELVESVDRIAEIVTAVYTELSQVEPNLDSIAELSRRVSEEKKLSYPHIRKAYNVDA